MSENAVLAALRRMGYTKEEMTGHGFRAMERTVLDEVLQFRPDYIEHQLAHAVRIASVDRMPQNDQYLAQIATQEAYTTANRTGRPIDLPVGQMLWPPLFDRNGQPLTHGRNQSPVFREVNRGWRDTMIVLKTDTPGHRYGRLPTTGRTAIGACGCA